MRTRRHGFVLLEVMVAVTIFSLGVIVLANCVNACLVAEVVKQEDTRARRLLANRMAEIEGGLIPLSGKNSSEEMKGMWAGMTLKTAVSELKKKNENGQEIQGVKAVRLDLTWQSDNREQARELTFYVYPRQQ